MQYQKRLLEDFAVLFDGSEEPTEETDASKWGWYHALSEMANGDVEKIERLTELPVTQLFHHLAYLKDLSK